MGAVGRFFSLRGRSNRLPYWVVTLAVYFALMAIAALGFLGLVEAGEVGEAEIDAADGPVGVLLLLAFAAFGVALTLPVAVRRLHDRDKSGWWTVPYVFVPALIIDADTYRPLGLDVSTDVVTIGNVISYGLTIAAFVDLGIVRGTDGPNRYGPDPLNPDAYDPDEARVFD